jgi:DNA-binding NtrC family response regulator
MGDAPFRTITIDTSEALLAGEPFSPPSLVRFFRADDPFDPPETFALSDESEWMIGRVSEPPSDRQSRRIWSCDDGIMSGRHAVLTFEDALWHVSDAGSKNGTSVNGHRIAPLRSHPLQNGDVIECGHSFFVFRGTRTNPPRPAAPIGQKVALAPLYYQIAPIYPYAATEIGIHLCGETGTGKEVVARAIHDLSGRTGAFVGLNCAAIPEHLFEAELFGSVKGAFSGATERRTGFIQSADEGTLFLDEIGELPIGSQAKLLRVLELREVQPLGSTRAVPVNFRLISATLCDLREMVEAGRFRRDLYARLGQVLKIPPLRSNVEELGRLTRDFLAEKLRARLSQGQSVPKVCFSLAASRALVRHDWPLNIRELKQTIVSAFVAVLAEGDSAAKCTIDLRHLPAALSSSAIAALSNELASRPSEIELPLTSKISDEPGTIETKSAVTDESLIAAFRLAEGNRAKTAKILNITERTVYRRLGQLRGQGIELPES